MLSKALVFVFVVLGIWAMLISNIPSEFIYAAYSPTYRPMQVRQEFEAQNLLMYSSWASDSMTYPYSSLTDGPSPPDWELNVTSQYLEVWWSTSWTPKIIMFNHVEQVWWGWQKHCELIFSFVNGTEIAPWITKEIAEQAWSSTTNSSRFYVKCDHISTSVFFVPTNQSKTIGEAWDEGKISYTLSYDVDWTKQGTTAWTIIKDLLTFKAPDLGIPGLGGQILSAVVAFGIWPLIAYICYKFVAGLLPFVSGGSGD